MKALKDLLSKISGKVNGLTSGKKTYTIAILLLVFAIAGFTTGQLDQDQAVLIILNAFGLGGLRNAIK